MEDVAEELGGGVEADHPDHHVDAVFEADAGDAAANDPEIDMSKLDVSEAVDQIVGTLCALGHLPDDTQEATSEDQELLSQKLRDLGYVE